jgi:hypothetical protein
MISHYAERIVLSNDVRDKWILLGKQWKFMLTPGYTCHKHCGADDGHNRELRRFHIAMSLKVTNTEPFVAMR